MSAERAGAAITSRFDPAGPLLGSLRPPPDKSISHRAALIAAMADGESTIENYLHAADTSSTLAAVEALGARVEGADGIAEETRVSGVGLHGASPARVDVGNAGTLLRLLPGWLAGQSGSWELDGDESIRRRPVDRIVEPLREMGASLSCREGRLPPLAVEGSPLRGIEYELPVASAQVKSCVLFAGLLAEGATTVVERLPSRDHTERMLAAAGAEIARGDGMVTVRASEGLSGGRFAVPGDFSSAAFFIVAALLVGESEIAVEAVGVNPTRTGLLGILERMGADVSVETGEEVGGEPVGTIVARSTGELRAVDVGAAEVPSAIDELPLVALAACFAEGTTRIGGARELRSKESDRIETVVSTLRDLGATVEATDDGMVVEGRGGLPGGAVDSHGDHRIAMLGAVAGLASREGVVVDGMDAAGISYPAFEADLASLVR